MKATVKARRDYTCDLCRRSIPKGSEYVRADVTPWNCGPDCGKGFYTLHHHPECDLVWQAEAADYDYEPPDADCWRQVVEGWGRRQKPPEDGYKPDDVVVVWFNLSHWFPGTATRIGTVVEVKPDEGDGEHVMLKFPGEEKLYAHSPGELALIERKPTMEPQGRD